MKAEYTKAIAAAQAELEGLMVEKRRIDARISRLKATIETLSALSDERAADDVAIHAMGAAFEEGIGPTDAIRAVLSFATKPMKVPEIRDVMRARNYDLGQYANELTVIHNTIKRMHTQGEVEGDQNGWRLIRTTTPRGGYEMLQQVLADSQTQDEPKGTARLAYRAKIGGLRDIGRDKK
jgi:hypothetical protein